MRRRTYLVTAAAAIAAAAVPAAAGADQASCQPGAGPVGGAPTTAGGVNVHQTANNSIVWCSAAVIQANSDVADGTNYPVRATSQSPNYNPVSNAISVTALLTLAGANPASVNHAEIARLNGSWSSLTTPDLVDPAARFDDGLKPIVWINGAETQYLRPLRDPSDTNGDDQIVASNGEALDLFLYSGPVLTVKAKATPRRVAIKQPVTLTARVTNGSAADGALTYRWSFQDGSTATGATVRHAYAVAGTWHPVVTVQGQGDNSGGASDPITVTVGSAPKRAGDAKPGGTKPSHHAGGSTQSAGKTPNSVPTPRSSATPAPSQPPPESAATPESAPTPESRPVQTPRPHSQRRHARTVPHKRVRRRHAAGTTVVRGRLIADVTPLTAAQLARASGGGRPSAAPARPGGQAAAPLAALAGGLAFVLLLGSGAGVELRSLPRRRTQP